VCFCSFCGNYVGIKFEIVHSVSKLHLFRFYIVFFVVLIRNLKYFISILFLLKYWASDLFSMYNVFCGCSTVMN
jgi:hypothetical protein